MNHAYVGAFLLGIGVLHALAWRWTPRKAPWTPMLLGGSFVIGAINLPLLQGSSPQGWVSMLASSGHQTLSGWGLSLAPGALLWLCGLALASPGLILAIRHLAAPQSRSSGKAD